MRVVVCDDEPLARERLSRLLREMGHDVAAQVDNGIEAIEAVKHFQPEVVMLDIRMPEMDGIRCAESLSAMTSPPAIIFVTAFDQHAIDAFRTGAIGYLLKPVNRDELDKALGKASRLNVAQLQHLRRLDNPDAPPVRQNITARTHRGLELIALDDIYYFLADQKYITVRHKGGEVLIDETLKDLETEFGDRFIRIHRNALLALNYLEGLEMVSSGQYQVRCKGIPERLAISRRHLPEIREKMHAM